MFLYSWTSLFFWYSFNEAHLTSECKFIQRRSFFLFSQCSPVFPAWHYFWNWVSCVSQIMCLYSPTKKRQFVSFRSLKNYHVLAFWHFIPSYKSWSQVCLSPLTHTWLIERGGVLMPKRHFHWYYTRLLL